MNYNGRISFEELDPLKYFQEGARRRGIDLGPAKITRGSLEVPFQSRDYPSFLQGCLDHRSERASAALVWNVIACGRGGNWENGFNLVRVPRQVIDFGNSVGKIDGKSASDFDLTRDGLNPLNYFYPHFGASFSCEKMVHGNESDGCIEDTVLWCDVVPTEGSRNYRFRDRIYQCGKGKENLDKKLEEMYARKGIKAHIDGILDLYASVYVEERKVDVTTLAKELFGIEEGKVLIAKLEKAKLGERKGFVSVPKLSLGVVNLPTPGQRDLGKDEFVVEGAPYLIEELDRLGVMSRDEAERLVGDKLVRYFMTNTQYQHNRDAAERIVNNLRGRDRNEEAKIA